MLSRVSSFSHHVLGALDVLFSASRAAGAVERGGMPDARDLDRLGIEASAFTGIHHA